MRISPHWFVLFGLATLIAAPLSAPGYFMFAHDARHTVYFMQMFDAALRDGALYPRWAADMVFGYGYPVWLILAPLPYYGAEFLHLLGLDFPASIKAVEALAWYSRAGAMFLLGARVLGREGGLVAAVAYLFVPYHIVDLYVRGAMAEFMAFVFPPLVLWAVYQIYTTRRLIYVPLAALCYAALILTHISMAVLFSPVIVGYILVLKLYPPAPDPTTAEPLARGLPAWTRGPAFLSALALVWAFGLAAVFLLPVLAEQRYLTSEPLIGGFFDFRLHFVNPAQFLSPFWGYGYAGVNGGDQFSLQLGILPLFLGTIALFTFRRRETWSAQLVYFALVVAASVLAMLALSKPLWELAAPVIAFAQFPWRLLFVTAPALAILAGSAVPALAVGDAGEQGSSERAFGDRSLPAAVLLALLLAFAMFPFARPQYSETQFTWNSMMDFQVNDGELLGDTVWVDKRPETSPLVEQYRAGQITTKAVVVQGEGTVNLTERRPLGDTVRVDAAAPVQLMFYTRYFPGWTASIDGARAAIEPYGEQGLIAVDVPAGTHTVTTRWGSTLPRIAGAVISLVSALAAGVWLWRTRKGS